MFKNDRQRAAVCRALTAWMNKGEFWSPETQSATPLGIRLRETGAAKAWSHGEQLMWHLAWSLWTSECIDPPAGELFFALDPERQMLVATLLMAAATTGATTGDAVDSWLQTVGQHAEIGKP